MRFITIITVFCALFVGAPLKAQTNSELNGNFWKALNATQKNIFIGGYFVGFKAGIDGTKDAAEVLFPRDKDAIERVTPTLTRPM
jgi:hypothetical protein